MADNYIATVENVDIVLEELLEDYLEEDVIPGMRKGITKTVQKMVRETKRTAPKDGGKWKGFPAHREGGTFAKHIGYNTYGFGSAFYGVWRVKAPEYRLAHLLENGHQLLIFGKNAHKRTKALNFVEDARNVAEAEVVKNIIEEIGKS